MSALTRRDLAYRPLRNLADAVQQTPGVAFVDFEGTGSDPQAIVRGFYGGGEADYMLLLVDGRPLNALETGRINWDMIPLSAIESIEIVRGPASAAWGDAALGGVINVFTRSDGAARWRAALRGAQHGSFRGSVSGFGTIAELPVAGFAELARANGFRDHAERSTGAFYASVGRASAERGTTLSIVNDWRDYDEPGPLTGDELATSRTQSSPFYRFDHAEEWLTRVTLDTRTTKGSSRLSASVSGEYRDADRVRTLRLAPDFADTKNRVLTSGRVFGSTELERGGLLLGLDVSYGKIDSEYYNFAAGPGAAYRLGTGSRGAKNGEASGNRSSAAGFARYGVQVTSTLALTAGARLDWLRDEFETDATRDTLPDPRTHLVLSPRAGLNFQYLNDANQRGHLYLSVARSFKAPTPDQLYDRRKIPVPFPPFSITFANADLEPQHGINYEAGIYHSLRSVDLTLAAYQLDLKDEVDFDIETFSYRNIGQSRHRGIEAGLHVRPAGPLGGFVNYTLQAVTSQSGDDAGKYLKAIPRHFVVAGGSARHKALTATLSATTARKTWLDDANTLELPDWTRWDARVTYDWRGAQVFADVLNIADAEYSTTGFPDAAGGAVYYHPAAGRTLQLGLSWSR